MDPWQRIYSVPYEIVCKLTKLSGAQLYSTLLILSYSPPITGPLGNHFGENIKRHQRLVTCVSSHAAVDYKFHVFTLV